MSITKPNLSVLLKSLYYLTNLMIFRHYNWKCDCVQGAVRIVSDDGVAISCFLFYAAVRLSLVLAL